MAKNTLTLIITADGKKALDTINATSANLRKLSTQTYELEKRIKAGNEVSASMADAYRLINDLVNRHVLAQKQLNPSINENEAALKAWGEAINTVSTQGGALGSETLEYLKMQYASVAEQIQKATEQITNESKPIDNTAKSVEDVSKATDSLAVSTKKASSYWSKLFDTTKNVLMFRVIMNVINSISNLSNFLNDSVQAAAEAEQVFSKLNTVFGETSGAMAEVVSLASQIGVASSTAASALSTVGDLLQAQGQTTTQSLETATEWVSQFQDIIAFKDINMSLEEFAQNFMSGAAGNLRNFRTFGSIVKESAVNAELAKKGLDKLTGAELELAKMTTRAEMALEQQKNAIGATKREWDTMLSVNRRYEEAVKGIKESFGDWFNNVVKPVKNWWASILEDINNANKAQEEFLSGKKNINVYDLSDQSDFNNFYEKISSAISTGFYDESSGMQYSLIEAESAIIKFGASAKDVEKVIERLYNVFEDNDVFASGEKFSTFIDKLRKSLKSVETDRDFENQMKDWNNGLKDLAENADAFIEALAELKGVEGVSSDYISMISGNISSEKIAMNKRNAINESIKKNIETAIKSITETSLENYSNITEKLFEEDSVQKAYTAWLEEIESMYVILYNRMIKYGDVTQEQLDEVYKKWEDINKEADKYSKLESAYNTGATGGSYTNDIRLKTRTNLNQGFLEKNYAPFDVDVPEGLAQAYAEIELYYEDILNSTNLTIEERKKLKDLEFEEKNQAKEYLTILEKENKEREKASKLEELATGTADYEKQLAQLEMSDYEKTLDDFDRMLKGITDQDIVDAITKQKEAFIALTEATEAYDQKQTMQQAWENLGSQATGAFGEFGTLVTSLDSLGDVLGGGGGLLSILIDILAKTEVATRLSSLLTDSILPTLNAFLEPLLPIIDMLSEAIKSLVEIVLVPLFPILQGIASTLALVIGSVMTGLDLIANGVKKTIGYIVSGIENAVNWIIDMFNKIPGVNIGKVSFGPSNWADIDLQGVLEEDMAWIGDTLEKIAESNMEISDNTDPAKDFSTYQKLLAAKEIDEATYNRWTGMDKYTTQSLANGVSYAQGNRSYINVNNLTVQAPEGMTLVDFLKGIEDYNSGHSPYAVNTMAV